MPPTVVKAIWLSTRSTNSFSNEESIGFVIILVIFNEGFGVTAQLFEPLERGESVQWLAESFTNCSDVAHGSIINHVGLHAKEE